MTDRILAHRHRLVNDENSKWWTLASMCFALFMIMLDNTVVNVALPSIQRDLHASLASLEWTVNAYTLTFAVLLVTGGRLGDIFGRRRMFLFGVVVFALVEGNAWHWGSARIVSLLLVAVVGIVAFLVIELRTRTPMLDFSFFRSRTFLGASLVAFVISFAMLAMFFFMALYMQNILRFSPLQAGIRFLPSTLMIVLLAPLAGRLADRVGPRPLITFGLLAVSGALFWQSQLTVSSGYGTLLPGFMLMGIGMAFVMSPMSMAAMNAVAQAKAGVASGILSMNRMVGGTFGVAVLGAMVATLGRTKIDELLPQLPGSARARLAEGLGSGAAPHGVSAQILDAA